jgi:predicted MFS family arabinose efflux permease
MLKQNKYLPYLMWFLPVLFFSNQFILRLWPGLMKQEIMTQFAIDATSFGILASVYYYGYAGMQIPIAILLDRYGARLILFLFALICGLATILFTYSDNYYLALLSRFLVGAGSAVGFLGTSKVISEWFPHSQYARMIGYSFTFGLMGAVFGGKPINHLIEIYSWQTVALQLALLSIFIGCAAYLILRKPTIQTQDEPLRIKDFSHLFTSPLIWLLALANLLMVGALEGFADVWGVSYLMQAYGLAKGEAAGLTTFIFYGMLVGGPFLAFLSQRLGTYTVIATCGVGMAFAFAFLLMNPSYQWWILPGLLFAVGMMCCYQVIVFAAGSDLVSAHYLGVTIAFLNCINMLGGSFFHTLIGRTMDLYWTGGVDENGIKHYSLVAYKMGLSVIPICAVIGALLTVFVGLKVKRQYASEPK